MTMIQGMVGRGSSQIKTYIIFCQETGAEFQIVIQIKGPSSLESRPEGCHCRGFGQLPHALDSPKLALGVLGGCFGASAGPTVVVMVVVVVVGGGRHVSSVVRVLVVLVLAEEEGRHCEEVGGSCWGSY